MLSAGIGEGLFFAGTNHVAMAVKASKIEHDLVTTNPAEILKQQKAADINSVLKNAAEPSISATPAPQPQQAQPQPQAPIYKEEPIAQVMQPQPTPVQPIVTEPQATTNPISSTPIISAQAPEKEEYDPLDIYAKVKPLEPIKFANDDDWQDIVKPSTSTVAPASQPTPAPQPMQPKPAMPNPYSSEEGDYVNGSINLRGGSDNF